MASTKDDRLDRNPRAKRFAEHIRELDLTQGAVVGVVGPWGAGKTTFLNYTSQALAGHKIIAISFNPWMFSGAEQLVTAFFDQLAEQLRLKTSWYDLADDIEHYGDALAALEWLPKVGDILKLLGRLGTFFKKRLKARSGGLAGRRDRIEKALRALPDPVVVMIDDIDRLTPAEVREVFRLVRLTANFPNLAYVLAFDRARVENSLTLERFDGRAYLEKIMQLVVELPVVPRAVVQRETFAGIDEALARLEVGPFEQDRWADVFAEIVDPLITTMRDVRRYAMGVRNSATDLGPGIALVDMLALVAVHLFLPDVHARLPRLMGILTKLGRPLTSADVGRDELEAAIAAAGDRERQRVARAFFLRLFPASEQYLGNSTYSDEFMGTWRDALRVAHPAYLQYYLERVEGSELAAILRARQALLDMTDANAFAAFFNAIPAGERASFFNELVGEEERFTREAVEPASEVLLNAMPNLPQAGGGLFDFGPETAAQRVVYRLLRKCRDEDDAAAAVRGILPRLTSLWARMTLLNLASPRAGADDGVMRREDVDVLRAELRDQLRALEPEQWAQEPRLYEVATHMLHQAQDAHEAPIAIPDRPDVTLAILVSGRSIGRRQSMGSRAVTSFVRLPWEDLEWLFGDAGELGRRIEVAKQSAPPDDETLALARCYLDGWRPGMNDD